MSLFTYFLTYLLFETFGSFSSVIVALCRLQYLGYDTDDFPSKGLRNFFIDFVLVFDINGGGLKPSIPLNPGCGIATATK